jgi:hypothetical protein
MVGKIIIIVCGFFFCSCATPDSKYIDNLIRDLNAREAKSCVEIQGAFAPYGFVKIITATGGTDLETCFKNR